MKISISKDVEKEINKYLLTKEDNMSAVELINILLSEENNNLDQQDLLRNGNNYFKALIEKTDVDINDEYFKSMDEKYHFSDIKQLNENDYTENEYFVNIKPKFAKNKNRYLCYLTYNSFQAFTYDEINIDNKYFKETVPVGYFKEKFTYPAIIDQDKIWMSIIPHEINTMKKPIKNAFGKVLVIGLGLGYFTYMISLKDEVDEIVVIEKDKKIIELFNEEILPRFVNKNKIKIINKDAFEYLEEKHDFDYVFMDIWHNVGDGIYLYLATKYYENYYTNTHFDYWIEESLIAMLRRMILTVFEEQYYSHFTSKDYLKAKNKNDKVINKIYFYTENYCINNIDDFRNMLSNDFLKEMAKKLYL
ncbi:MAG TPA: hypothetical protein DDW20_05065 [Firmicutes bacterium]|nr:hypothetical protein [Bacillota bacterium]